MGRGRGALKDTSVCQSVGKDLKMRKHIIAAVAGAMLLAGTIAASALEITASITHIDTQARIIVIDHRAFHVPTSVDIRILRIGQQITVVYVIVARQLRIESIKID